MLKFGTVIFAVYLAAANSLVAQPAVPATAPSAPRSSLLQQLNGETEALYKQVQGGIVRVQLPPPKWVNEIAARDNPVDKWGPQLAEKVKAKLEQGRRDVQAGNYSAVRPQITSSTQPNHAQDNSGSNGPAANAAAAPWRVTQIDGNNTVVIEPAAGGASAVIEIHTGGDVDAAGNLVVGGPPNIYLRPVSDFAPNNVGLVFDDAGHVLVPLFIEKETIGSGVWASVGGGVIVNATFVAADRQTNLTVLKLEGKSPRAVRLAVNRPVDGSLVMLLAPNSASAKLQLWTAGQADVAGVVVGVDGSIAGFARFGQFLSAASCKPVVEQLVQYGRVKRAILGVAVREVFRGDPVRGRNAELGSQPALRVEDVTTNSAAAKAGLEKGDLILSVAGEPVGDPASFAAAISARSGETPLRVLRAEKAVEIKVELVPQ